MVDWSTPTKDPMVFSVRPDSRSDSMAVEGSMGMDCMPFGIRLQCRTAFYPTNGMQDHSGMHKEDLLRSNIRYLIEDRKLTEAEVGERSGVRQSWLNRYMRRLIVKASSAKISQLADFFGIPAGDLVWKDLTSPETKDASQPVGSEQEIVEAAVRLVRELEAMSPEPLPQETYGERLYIAMKVIRDEGAAGILDETALMPALRRFAAELRKTG
ncbi:helix-turn-helix domain-containing protein [Stenotrophomonas maltophilia]|uniref:helix-turn-helix domain-containing protein n=1 Tax=Stenotrophomonas maltophilia TaxID=40324 RepID=UPI0012DB0179|nr:helix-turn-helix transcriptional regulator [Stenotrophomonas maltophilia]